MRNLEFKILLLFLLSIYSYAIPSFVVENTEVETTEVETKSKTEIRIDRIKDIVSIIRKLPKDLENKKDELDKIATKLDLAANGIISFQKSMKWCLSNTSSIIKEQCEKDAKLRTGSELKKHKEIITKSQTQLVKIIDDLKEAVGGIDLLFEMLKSHRATLELEGVNIEQIIMDIKKLEVEEKKRKLDIEKEKKRKDK